MTKAIFIDAANREIKEVDLPEGEIGFMNALRKLVDGWLETAWRWDAGDVLFVDEDGTRKPQAHFFRLTPCGAYPLTGNGVIIGPEHYDDQGEYLGTDDTTLTVEQVRPLVTFLNSGAGRCLGQGQRQ